MNNENKSPWIAIVAAVTSLAASPASAIPIVQVAFSSPIAVQSELVNATVSVTNLNSELVGAYDFELDWDPALLSFESILFDTLLDGPGDSIQGFTAGTGRLNAFEVSLGLLVDQAGLDTFRLFTATFEAIGTGTASLGFAGTLPQLLVNDLGEEYVGTTLLGATLLVSPPVSVPEPSTLSTLLIGLPALLAMRKPRQRKQAPNAR
jgi:hypothetical protein